jgi:thiamine transporter ThiT
VGGSTLLYGYVVGVPFHSASVPSNLNFYIAHLRHGRLFYTSYEMFAERSPYGTTATLFSIEVNVFDTVLTFQVGFLRVLATYLQSIVIERL